MSNVGRDYLACAAARKQGICTNTRGIRRHELEALVLDALPSRMMAPALVAEFITSFTDEWNRAAGLLSAGRDATARELAAVDRKLTGLINALADGFRGAGLQAQLDELEAKRLALTAKLSAAAPSVPRLHPNIAQVYRDRVERLHDALAAGSTGPEALTAARALIERVVLTPSLDGKGFEIEVLGELGAMLRLGMADTHRGQPVRGTSDPDMFDCSVKVVARTGNRRCHHVQVQS